jgi:hypothetical protein
MSGMRIGLTDKVPMDELEYTKQQLENSKTLLFSARSVREAVFLQERMRYLNQRIKELKGRKAKVRAIKKRRVAA